jgi:transposase
MLGKGIAELKSKNIIDQRLFDWSEQLQAFRNIAAHPEGAPISRADAEDLQEFVYAIIEYIYVLTDRYEEFKERLARKARKKKAP